VDASIRILSLVNSGYNGGIETGPSRCRPPNQIAFALDRYGETLLPPQKAGVGVVSGLTRPSEHDGVVDRALEFKNWKGARNDSRSLMGTCLCAVDADAFQSMLGFHLVVGRQACGRCPRQGASNSAWPQAEEGALCLARIWGYPCRKERGVSGQGPCPIDEASKRGPTYLARPSERLAKGKREYCMP
jgi:hypothetical protein